MTHFKKVCMTCNKIISQCRCMSYDKVTTYEQCEDCKPVQDSFIESLNKEPNLDNLEKDRIIWYHEKALEKQLDLVIGCLPGKEDYIIEASRSEKSNRSGWISLGHNTCRDQFLSNLKSKGIIK